MKLYKISQETNNGYDTYDSAIVAAECEEEARKIHPSGNQGEWRDKGYSYHSWCRSEEDVIVQEIGEAAEGTPRGVILASYNAG